jgi:hypothetical protein
METTEDDRTVGDARTDEVAWQGVSNPRRVRL